MKLEETCKFCQIYTGKNPHKIIYQDKQIMGFKNINQHYGNLQILWSPLEHMTQEEMLNEETIVNDIMKNLINYAKQQQMDYRLVVNVGLNSNQMIEHGHIHQIFSTKPLSESPYCYHPKERYGGEDEL